MDRSFYRIFAIVLRQYYLMRGSVSRIMPHFVWVTIDIVLWGFFTRYLGALTAAGGFFVPTLLGAVLLWDFFIRVMQGITMAFFEDVWSRNFLNVFATPIRVSEYVAGLVVCSSFMGFAALLFMLVLAGTVFGLPVFFAGMMAIPFLCVLFLFGIAIGIVGTGIVLRFGPASEWFIWPIPALLSPFASVFYPVTVLPEWMQAIARLMPPVYVFEGLRAVVSGGMPSVSSLLCGGVLAVGYLVLAGLFFQATFRRAVRTGLIARYSAETVS
jgi:ABC-2 type transport system permease protein